MKEHMFPYETIGVGRRFVAQFTDWIVLFMGWTGLIILSAMMGRFLPFGQIEIVTNGIHSTNISVFYSIGSSGAFNFAMIMAYYVISEWKFKGTIGKWITGIQVIQSNGEPLDLRASLIRNFLRIIDFLPGFYLIGAISIWNTKSKQRIGDRLANTYVVSRF